MNHVTRSDAALPPGPGLGGWPRSPRDALGGTTWLRSVPDTTLNSLAGEAILHRVPAGSILFEQSETPALAQMVLAGSVALLGVRESTEMLVELIRPVDLLLPAAVLNRQPYLLRARVLEEAHLLILPAEALRRAVCADHSLALALLACQAAQFRRQIKQAKNVRLRAAEDRIGCYLLRLAEQAAPGQPARLPLEKRLIASELGMTRETFSRTLPLLVRHGLRVEGDHVILEDPVAARARFPLDPLIDGPEDVALLTAERK